LADLDGFGPTIPSTHLGAMLISNSRSNSGATLPATGKKHHDFSRAAWNGSKKVGHSMQKAFRKLMKTFENYATPVSYALPVELPRRYLHLFLIVNSTHPKATGLPRRQRADIAAGHKVCPRVYKTSEFNNI
jgi:hypothetical protein